MSVSSVRIVPDPQDDGRVLKCRGENTALAGSVLDDSILFNVVCEYMKSTIFMVPITEIRPNYATTNSQVFV